MSALDARIACLEGKVADQSQAVSGIRDAIVRCEQRVDARFEAADRRFDSLDRRVDTLDEKVSRQFVWVVGIQVSTFVAIVGALLSRGCPER